MFSPFIIFELPLISVSVSLCVVASYQSITVLFQITDHSVFAFPPWTEDPPQHSHCPTPREPIMRLEVWSVWDSAASSVSLCSHRQSWQNSWPHTGVGCCELWHRHKVLEENCGKQKAFQIAAEAWGGNENSIVWECGPVSSMLCDDLGLTRRFSFVCFSVSRCLCVSVWHVARLAQVVVIFIRHIWNDDKKEIKINLV